MDEIIDPTGLKNGTTSTLTPTHSGGKNVIVEQKVAEQSLKTTTKHEKVNKTKKKVITQMKLPQHPNINYARTYHLRFDFRLKLDSVMEEVEAKEVIVEKFREMIKKLWKKRVVR